MKLIVRFPEVEALFGDVPAGVTTHYVPIPYGVFSYAAYRLEVNGQMISQPVIDWVGEQPMDGRAFTYTIEVDVSQSRPVRLMSVTRDE
jgi:hypothetical protein